MVDAFSGARFSLRVLGAHVRSVSTSPRRLKPSPLFGQSKCRRAMVIVLFAAFPVVAQQQTTPKTSQPQVPKRDLSGLWHYQSTGASEPVAPDNLIPPMTPWAQARFDAEKPGYGPRRAPGGNDPILQCDPMGFPRVMFLNTPFEFVQVAGRVIQFFEHEHEYRTIWTDGRALPINADPTWYGTAIGHWERDDTLVVESTGFRDSHLAWVHRLPAQRRHAHHRALSSRGS